MFILSMDFPRHIFSTCSLKDNLRLVRLIFDEPRRSTIIIPKIKKYKTFSRPVLKHVYILITIAAEALFQKTPLQQKIPKLAPKIFFFAA